MQKSDIKYNVELSQRGDSDAFGQLFVHFFPEIYRYLVVRIRHTQEAEDLAAEVFIKVWSKLSLYDPVKASFRVWLYRVARNQLMDFVRQKREVTELNENLLIVSELQVDKIITDAEKRRLVESLEKLTDLQYQVIYLKFFTDLSNKEIAVVADKKEGAIRAIQFRALKSLKELLQDYYVE